jgi:coenzyme F420-reducing hydrogenase gamma subunit
LANKLQIAIFDLTDCEGCELQFLSLREKLADLGKELEISNWRLANTKNASGPFKVTFIEGSPISESDIEIIKQARRVSEVVVTLGTCAAFGGIQASLPVTKREKYLKEIYGEKYKIKSKTPKPVSYYIEVDTHLPGCPINPPELEELLSCLEAGKKFTPKTAPVCFDCKKKNNACLFLDEGFCLGPVTKGGCGAPCPSVGLKCYGCFGPMPGVSLKALSKAAPFKTTKELDQDLRMFYAETPEYQLAKTTPRPGQSGGKSKKGA